jgi:hypothetical protein
MAILPPPSTPDLTGLERDTLTIRDVARYFGVCLPTARKMAREPGFPLIIHDNTWRVPRRAFLRWVARRAGLGEDAGEDL